MKNLIPAYDIKHMKDTGIEESYMANTLLAKTEREIISYIKTYMKRNICSFEVINFLTFILNHRQYMNKIQIVNDGSARNVVFLVRPDGFMKTHGETEYGNFENQMADFYNRAETIFINITDETWAEVIEWDKLFTLPDWVI